MRNGQQMVPTLVGFVVIQLLERHFPDFVDANFTSKMEATLDAIAKGSVDKGRYVIEGSQVAYRMSQPYSSSHVRARRRQGHGVT